MNVSKLSTKKLRRLVANQSVIKKDYDCEYGHFNCSCRAYQGGPCLNEVEAELYNRGEYEIS